MLEALRKLKIGWEQHETNNEYVVLFLADNNDWEHMGLKPIIKTFMEPNYEFAMQWSGGSKKPSKFMFGRVINRRIMQYKPWPLINGNGEDIDIEPSSHQAEVAFNDPRNTQKDILYLDTEISPMGWPWFLHGAFGPSPEWIKMWPKFPTTTDIDGKFPNLDPIQPSANDNISYINSQNSPYDCPSNYRQYVIPPKLHIGAEYFNTDDEDHHQPAINILYCLYWFQVLKPEAHSQAIREIATRPGRPHFFTIGFGDQPLAMGIELEQKWLGEEVELMTLEEAATL